MHIVSGSSSRPLIEPWYDVLKKVSRLWKKGTLSASKENHDALKQNDINDFYIYLFDEEDISTQT